MKPISFFDLETTGPDKSKDRIVEIAIIQVGTEEKEFHSLVNPEIPIPPEATEVHGITDEKVKDAPTIKELAPKIIETLSGSDLAGFNSNLFDIPLLYNELHRVGHALDLTSTLFFDACTIFKRKEERTLSAAVNYYLNREHTDAHGALSDVKATIEVFKAQRAQYEDLTGMRRSELALYCNYDNHRADVSGRFAIDQDGDYILNFGKYKGKKAADCKEGKVNKQVKEYIQSNLEVLKSEVKNG